MKISVRKRLGRHVRGYFRSKVLDRHGVAIVAETKNGLLAVDPGDFNVSRELLTRGEYDWGEIAFLSSLVSPTSRIAVVGAHLGALLIPIVRGAGIEKAIAYEPSPRNYSLLMTNLALNGLRTVVDARNVAVGERVGSVGFVENRINTGNSRVSAHPDAVKVPLETLDGTIPSDWDAVDLMIMDIEGSEVRAMRGAERTLARTHHLYIELAPEQLHEQGSTVQELIDLVSPHFQSAAVLAHPPKYLDLPGLAHYLSGLPRRGLLLNILFSRSIRIGADASA